MTPTGDRYIHGHSDSVLRSHRWRTAANSAGYLLARLQPGMRLLDVGCGPGTLTVDLARHVGPAGQVVGVDLSETVVAEAAAHAAAEGVANVSFRAGDFRGAALGPRSFDVVHAHQVLQHLSDPVGALAAMAGLARPGGLVAARDSDYLSFFWTPADARLDRWREVYLAVTGRNGAEADAGRWLLQWAHAAGLSSVSYTSSTWTFATPDERNWWAEVWADRCETSSFAEQAVAYGFASTDEMAEIARGWRAWATHDDAVFIVVHGEVIARV